MLPIGPVTKTAEQGGVVERTNSSGAVEETESVREIKPVGTQPIETDELMDTLRKESEKDLADSDEAPSNQEDEEGLRTRMEALEDAAQSYGHKLSFELRMDTGNMIVQVKDSEGEVIRQIPPEEFVKLSNRLEEMRGSLFDKFA